MELVEVIVWVLANSVGLAIALASAETFCSAVWMLVSWALSPVRPVCWFCFWILRRMRGMV